MPRQTNIELLRIISMLMVLTVHIDGASLGMPDTAGGIAALSARDIWQITVEAAAIIGVNCFTMISGYFGIHLRWRSVGAYLFQCLFYAVGIYTLVLLAGRCTWAQWWQSWLVLSHTDLWYVPAYFGLMLLSPLLNAGTEALPRHTFRNLLAAFILLNIWCGWWWRAPFNPTGYTLVQLIMVYLIARYMRLHISVESLHRHRRSLLGAYLAATVAIALSAIWLPDRAYAYNSPLVLISTVALFVWFHTLHIESRHLRRIARSAFAVYLLHKTPPVWGGLIKPAVRHLWATESLAIFTLAALLLAVAIYLITIPIDAIRRRLSDIILQKIENNLHN